MTDKKRIAVLQNVIADKDKQIEELQKQIDDLNEQINYYNKSTDESIQELQDILKQAYEMKAEFDKSHIEYEQTKNGFRRDMKKLLRRSKWGF